MKRLFTLVILLLVGNFLLSAQKASRFTEGDDDSHRDTRTDHMNFVSNEVLVKFKDDVPLKSSTLLKSVGINAIDRILQAHGSPVLEKLFPSETKLKVARVVKDPLGRDMVIPSLHNIYKIVMPELKSTSARPLDIFRFIEDLKALPEVEFAEPNYIISVDELRGVGNPISAGTPGKETSADFPLDGAAVVVPNDPLYGQSGHISVVKADVVWQQFTGDQNQVIAIVDTGVDWLHPDLAANIWRNPGEIPDNGIDDDGNGKIDDIMGWDFIDFDNAPQDDNSHGTHVAGIAAAVGNNGTGITGINWRARIMPVKVLAANGQGTLSSVIEGINYAANAGATVINMSLGTGFYSHLLEAALLNAFSREITLVAGAGNDTKDINESVFYPGGFSFVLGVKSEGAYSNFDSDGPILSAFPEKFNYELKAPGTILSTTPGGNYRILSGTSMATPVVAGAAALYRSSYSGKSQEDLWSDFIHSSNDFIDLEKVFFNENKTPFFDLLSYRIDDAEGGDNDSKPDAGETVKLILKIRNTGAPAVNAGVRIRALNNENNDITLVNDTVYFGGLTVYGTLENVSNPFIINVNPECSHNKTIELEVFMKSTNSPTGFTQRIKLNLNNRESLSPTLLTGTLVFTPDKMWLIDQSFKITPTGVLIIKPGTHVEITSKIINDGTIIARGKQDSIISISGTQISGGDAQGSLDFDYVDVNLCRYVFGQGCIQNQKGNITRSKLYLNGNVGILLFNGNISKSVFHDWVTTFTMYSFSGKISQCNYFNIPVIESGANVIEYEHNNFVNLKSLNVSPGNSGASSYNPLSGLSNNIISKKDNIVLYAMSGYTQEDKYQYWGTSDSMRIENMIRDFAEDAALAKINFYPYLRQPVEEAPGMVWKVLVNGKDAQDEIVQPVGVGRHRFDIYFNRQMNIDFPPLVSFGVREPFNQQVVKEDGAWSEDGKVYSVYKSVSLTTGDGINRIRISGAKDTEGFDIPAEYFRFELVVSASGSISNEFMATPGLGKVALEWNDADLEDGLGYNIYRMEQINDSTLSLPVMINSTLIADTLYTDYTVTSNKKYFYYYKILRTNLEETDSSKVVSAIPFSAALGDANGDLAVNVLDVTTIVAYLLNQNPQPFIFEAADVNGDDVINVLDIVAVVNKILNPGKSAALSTSATVNLYLQNDTLFADSPVAMGALQMDISGVSGMEEVQKLSVLQGFESGYNMSGNTLRLIVYSLTGKTIPAGNRIPLLRLKKGSGITNIIMGDSKGSGLTVNYLSTGLWNLHKLGEAVATLGQNYPNPFNHSTTIPVRVNEPIDEIVVRIINIAGQEIGMLSLKNPVIGENLLYWRPGTNKGMMAYLLEIHRNGKQAIGGVKKLMVK